MESDPTLRRPATEPTTTHDTTTQHLSNTHAGKTNETTGAPQNRKQKTPPSPPPPTRTIPGDPTLLTHPCGKVRNRSLRIAFLKISA